MEHELNSSGADLLLELAHNHEQQLLVFAAANFEIQTVQIEVQLDHAWAAALQGQPPSSEWKVDVLDAVSLRAEAPPNKITPASNGSAIVSVQIPPRSVLVMRIPLQWGGARASVGARVPVSERQEFLENTPYSCHPKSVFVITFRKIIPRT